MYYLLLLSVISSNSSQIYLKTSPFYLKPNKFYSNYDIYVLMRLSSYLLDYLYLCLAKLNYRACPF